MSTRYIQVARITRCFRKLKRYESRKTEITYMISPKEFLEKMGIEGELTTLFKRRGKLENVCIEFKVLEKKNEN